MFNDALRQSLLGDSQAPASSVTVPSQHTFVRGLDEVLNQLRIASVVGIRDQEGLQIIEPGDRFDTLSAPPTTGELCQRAEETIQVIQRIGESEIAAEVYEVMNEPIELAGNGQ